MLKFLAPLLMILGLAGCDSGFRLAEVPAGELAKSPQNWNDTFVRTCGTVSAKTCQLKACVGQDATCDQVKLIHLSTRSLECGRDDLVNAPDFTATVDGYFLHLPEESSNKESLVLRRAIVQRTIEACPTKLQVHGT